MSAGRTDGADVLFTPLDAHTVQFPAPASTGMPTVFELMTSPAEEQSGPREPNLDVALV